jgi:alpha-beta hydrolase superfamily lysophospholipase
MEHRVPPRSDAVRRWVLKFGPVFAIAAPIFALAASDDEIVAPSQATAIESKCRRAKVIVRVEPGRHLSLFMGRRTLRTVWRDIAHWLDEKGAANAKAANEAA